MSHSLRSLFRRWSVRSTSLVAKGDPATNRSPRHRLQPRLTMLENRSLPSITGADLYLHDSNTISIFDPMATLPNAGTDHVAVAGDFGGYDLAAGEINVAITQPSQYSVTNRFVFGNQLTGPNAASPVILSYDSTRLGNLAVPASAVGSTWGLAYDANGSQIYASAFMKKHVGFGPGGTGAIYVMGTSGDTAKIYVDLNAVFGAGTTGDDPHEANGGDFDVDNGNVSWDAVGKISLGGLDISPDGKFLYTINLADRRLYVIPTTGELNKDTIQRYDLPASIAGTDLGDLRPFAVNYYNGSVYVGAVNSAESTTLGGKVTGDQSALRAYVFRFDPTTNTFDSTPVLDIALDTPRGTVGGADGVSADWLPWTPAFNTIASGSTIVYPQPMLTGLTFDDKDNMILSLRDRAGDQTGLLLQSNPTTPGETYFGITTGDTLQATRVGDGWQLDDSATVSEAQISLSDDAVAKQFGGSNAYGDMLTIVDNTPTASCPPTDHKTNDKPDHGPSVKDDADVGGITEVDVVAPAPGAADLSGIVFSDNNTDATFDAGDTLVPNVTIQLYDSVLTLVDFTTTDANGAYSFVGLPPGDYTVEVVAATLPANTGFTTKDVGGEASDSDVDVVTGRTDVITLNGGDLRQNVSAGIVASTAGTASLGDFVWFDANENGIQDAGEIGVVNVNVNLLDTGGTLIASTITDANGLYLFTGIAPGDYILEFNPFQTGWFISLPDQGGDEKTDSDITDPILRRTSTITLVADEINTDVDAGLTKPTTAHVGDFAFIDVNCNGIQDPGDIGLANVTVNLLDPGNNVIGTQVTGTDGKYMFTNIAPGTYHIEFQLPAGYTFSPQFQGGNPALDSNANPLNGQTADFTLVASAADLTIDAGFCSIPGSIGDYVFFDGDCDGIQDPGDFGVPNQTVNLLNGAGTLLATQKTDANGLYLFTNLAPGTYIVEFVPDAGFTFSPEGVGGDPKLDSDADAVTGRTAVITLTAGEVNTDIDAGLCKPTSAILGDFVFLDLNCNGIQDPGDAGVAGVTVNLLDSGGVVINTQVTGADGKYLFTNIAPGSYSVQFTPPAGLIFSPQSVGGNPATDSDANPATGITPSVVLAAGDANLNIDAGLCTPALKGTLGDFVWLDTDCDGIQEAGEAGLAGVTVNLLNSSSVVIATTTTDINGAYLFANLDAGSYSVQFTPPAGLTFSPQGVGGNPATDSDVNPATGITPTVVLAAGETNLDIDAGLCPPAVKGQIGDFVWLDTDCDGIQDPGELGVANITVNLLNSGGTIIATTKTDVNGAYLFDNLDAGAYSVQFALPAGFAFTLADQGGNDAVDSDVATSIGPSPRFIISLDPPVGQPAAFTGQTGVVNLAAGQTNLTVDAGLVPLKTISGFVYVDANNNGIFDGGESPIPNVQITLTGTNNLGAAVVTVGVTNANGFYQVNNVRPGTYSLTETQPTGYLDGKDSLGTPFPGVVGDDLLSSIVIGCDTTSMAGVNYNFGELLPSSIQGFAWFDRNDDGVRQPTETGIGGVRIILIGVDINGTPILRSVATGADGTYAFTGLLSGVYTLREVPPLLFLIGKIRIGSIGGVPTPAVSPQSTTNRDITLIPLGFGVDAIDYDFGHLVRGTGIINKEELLASTPASVASLLTQSKFLPASPTYANAVSNTQLSDPSIIRFAATGQATGGSLVRVYDYTTGADKFGFSAYDASFTGGVRLAVADVTGDGVPDIITAPGTGGGPHIKVFDGSTGALVAQFFAYDTNFSGGVYVAAGDVNGDGVSEIITGAGEGGGTHVKVFSAGGGLMREFFAYDPNLRCGVRVAVGDVNGDGLGDIVTAAGVGGGPHIKVFSGDASQGLLYEFFAYDANFSGGVYVAAGDVNGDGQADIVTGAGAGGGSHVKVFQGGTNGVVLNQFFAYDAGFTSGVSVGALDINGDGEAEVLTAPASNFTSYIQMIDIGRQASLESFMAYDTNYRGGAFVTGGTRRNLL